MQVAIPAPLALLALALGGLLGWLNGAVIVRTGVNSFVVTLASANLFSGAMLILTKATPLNQLPKSVGDFGQLRRRRFDVACARGATAIGRCVFYGYSVVGRQILAIGANARAAEMSGVPVADDCDGHALSGLLAGGAGLLTFARVGAAMPAIGGDDWLLPSFLGPCSAAFRSPGGRVGRRRGPRRGPGHDDPQRPARHGHREFLASPVPWPVPAVGGAVAARARRLPVDGAAARVSLSGAPQLDSSGRACPR